MYKDFIYQNPLNSAYQYCISIYSSVQVLKIWNVFMLENDEMNFICQKSVNPISSNPNRIHHNYFLLKHFLKKTQLFSLASIDSLPKNMDILY